MRQQINLVNLRFRKTKKVFGAKTMGQALVVFTLGIQVLSIIGEQRVKALNVDVISSDARLKLAQAKQTVVNARYAPRAANKDIEVQIQSAEAELQVLTTVAGILERGEFGNTHGFSEYFKAFARQNVPGMWLTGVSVTGIGSDIVVEGRAMQPELVPGFITALKREPIMRGKSFDGMRITEQTMRKIEKNERGEKSERTVRAPYVGFHLQTSPIATGNANLAQANGLEAGAVK
ncbi:hypothetical protein [Massilia sp. TS11]|uniref:hypothetical protein n=1 Tax=Massilia sp. TS11 TaxID=2908003 RepID=UPI001EDB4ECB|nr:hypothetical protein [Massilia sp. TS11]MCG2584556.1 hypothetical protein [Massilia sp. TS11]